jgi:hypothetical protein
MRLPNCPKVTAGGVDNSRILRGIETHFDAYMITSTANCEVAKLNLLQDKMVPFQHIARFGSFTDIRDSIIAYFKERVPQLEVLKVTEPVQREKGLCGLIKTSMPPAGYKCFIDNREHTSNPDRVYNYMVCDGAISIGCFRSPGCSRVSINCE